MFSALWWLFWDEPWPSITVGPLGVTSVSPVGRDRTVEAVAPARSVAPAEGVRTVERA